MLERSGDAIAGHLGLSGVLFGATFLALATSLPEISTGLASVKEGDYKLAFSDIFGGNAFLPVLFLIAVLITGQPVLPQDLTALAILLTLAYVLGLLFRPQKKRLGLGPTRYPSSSSTSLVWLGSSPWPPCPDRCRNSGSRRRSAIPQPALIR
ncbi:MAG: hypothetical protein NVS2B15_24300 [Pseudarthrobacter sp.]